MGWSLLLLLSSCLLAPGQAAVQARNKRQTVGDVIEVYVNGTIYTVKEGTSWNTAPSTAIVIKNGVIEYVGTDEAALVYATAGALIKDLAGLTVLPGIHDVHQHALEAGNYYVTCKLEADKNPLDLEAKIAECNKSDPEKKKWVLGNGHSIHNLLEYARSPEGQALSPRALLDRAVPNKPAAFLEATSHSVWANSEALKLAGFVKGAPNPEGGVIMLTSTGEPNGILLENAANIMFRLAQDPKENPELVDISYFGLLESLKKLTENGVTSIVDARVYWRNDHHLVWKRAFDEGKLTARTVLALWAYPHTTDDQIGLMKSLYTSSSPLFRISQIKIYSDGILDSTTAAMLDPYLKDIGLNLGTGNTGLNYFKKSKTEEYVKALQDTGYDFLIHTIGDRGVQESVDAIVSATEGSNKYRHRLTHLEIVPDSAITKMAANNVLADLQVAGNFTLLDKYNLALDGLIPAEKYAKYIPVKSLQAAGARVTLSSDWDVSPLNPFIGMQHAVNRGPESVSLKDAIEMYTIRAAYTMRQETLTGSLEKGKAADLIVINKDIFKIDQGTIQDTKVLLTMLGGKEIFRNSKLNVKCDPAQAVDQFNI